MSYDAISMAQPADCSFSMILEVLLDVNSSNHIDPRLRIDLGSATLKAPGPSEVPGLDTDDTPTSEDDPAPIRSFQSLLITPHASLASVQEEDLPEDLTAEKPATYLGIEQEEDYYVNLDRLLGNSPVPLIPELSSAGEKSSDKEKDINVRNPMSVYNWLRKHQPQVFLQDHEVSSDKSAKTGDKRGAGKRASIAAAKATPEYLDEDGISYGADSSSAFGSRGKRKRDDDPSYRSKGGRPTKRKREDSAPGGKKLRKATNMA